MHLYRNEYPITWITNKPTEPGYYWYWGPVRKVDFKLKNHRLWPKTIALVGCYSRFEMVAFLGSTVTHRLEDLPDDAKWIGPIEEPE